MRTKKIYLMSNKNTVKEPEQDGLLFGRHGRDAQQRSEKEPPLSSRIQGILDEVKKGSEVLVEITPHFSTWDYTKSKF